MYRDDARVWTYDTPSTVPKRNWVDHVLAEVGVFRGRVKGE